LERFRKWRLGIVKVEVKMIEPYKIAVEQAVLDDLSTRLSVFRIPPSPEDRGWEDGTNLRYLSELVSYWRDRFDWRTQEAALNQLGHYLADVGGIQLHFIYERGRGPAPLPLVLAHGWPDGFQRFIKLIPLLIDPAAHGGDVADAFDIVVPSLPGFGFSPRHEEGPTRANFGELFHRLMTEALGYTRYGAHGGDVGAVVCDQLCRNHADAVVGVHFTNVPMGQTVTDTDNLTEAERSFLAQIQQFQKFGAGYMHIQGTKPWTPAAALNDSPAGLAAWIVEKMYAWSDCQGDIELRFTKDDILTNVMLYWITQSIGTSFLCYRDFMKPQDGVTSHGVDGGADRPRCAPTGFAVFPKEIANAPREWAERFYDVRHWSEMPAGGHFAAWEEPARLAEDLRTFFRPFR
jgi:pimeloyl-ACP methyl ester carboxylesterase